MVTYPEQDLQRYIETNFEGRFAEWIGLPFLPAKLLGSQVRCRFGVIDVLGTVGFTPLVVELKGEPATEKVAGQIARYRAAVEDSFEQFCYDRLIGADLLETVHLPEVLTICVVIAPAFQPKAVAALSRAALLLQALPARDGGFTIRSLPVNGTAHSFAQPHLSNLLAPVADQYIGWRIGVTMCETQRRLSSAPLPFEP